jgi:hypothetical protein
VVLAQVVQAPVVVVLEKFFLYATFTFALASGIHYVLVTGNRLRGQPSHTSSHLTTPPQP